MITPKRAFGICVGGTLGAGLLVALCISRIEKDCGPASRPADPSRLGASTIGIDARFPDEESLGSEIGTDYGILAATAAQRPPSTSGTSGVFPPNEGSPLQPAQTIALEQLSHVGFRHGETDSALGDDSGHAHRRLVPPSLHSRPGANDIVFLDFVGDAFGARFGNADTPVAASGPFDLDGDPLTFTRNEKDAMVQIWQQYAAECADEDIDVTTELPLPGAGLVTYATVTTAGADFGTARINVFQARSGRSLQDSFAYYGWGGMQAESLCVRPFLVSRQ